MARLDLPCAYEQVTRLADDEHRLGDIIRSLVATGVHRCGLLIGTGTLLLLTHRWNSSSWLDREWCASKPLLRSPTYTSLRLPARSNISRAEFLPHFAAPCHSFRNSFFGMLFSRLALPVGHPSGKHLHQFASPPRVERNSFRFAPTIVYRTRTDRRNGMNSVLRRAWIAYVTVRAALGVRCVGHKLVCNPMKTPSVRVRRPSAPARAGPVRDPLGGEISPALVSSGIQHPA
jgi:hypothetical protein